MTSKSDHPKPRCPHCLGAGIVEQVAPGVGSTVVRCHVCRPGKPRRVVVESCCDASDECRCPMLDEFWTCACPGAPSQQLGVGELDEPAPSWCPLRDGDVVVGLKR